MLFNPNDFTFRQSRALVLDTGLLIDVSNVTAQIGFPLPVAVTDAVWAILEDAPLGSGEQTTDRLRIVLQRLYDIFLKARQVFPNGFSLDSFPVALTRRATGKKEALMLRAVCGPGDDDTLVLTIMLPSES